MCGIFGYDLTQLNINLGTRALLLAGLAMLNDTRGGQGFGYLYYKNSKPKAKRGLGEINQECSNMVKHKLLMGHTRYATHGKQAVKNCHPFEVGDIIGAHNGVLGNHKELNVTHNRKFEVDSQHLFAHLNEGKPFDDISGYGAIEWIKKGKKKCIHLCKLMGGELAIYKIKIGDKIGVIWSSDEDHLIDALEMAGLTKYANPYKVESEQVYSVYDGQLWKVDKILELGSRYNRSWKLGIASKDNTTYSSKDNTTYSSKDKQDYLFDEHSYYDDRDLDWDKGDSVLEAWEKGEKRSYLVKCLFEDTGEIVEIYTDEFDINCTYWDPTNKLYVTSEKQDAFWERVGMI
jgi:hypothetical protein